MAEGGHLLGVGHWWEGAWGNLVDRWQGCLLGGSTGEQSSSNRWDALGMVKPARGHEG